VLAVIDYVWQRYRLETELKMSKQEVKEEMRRMEGDPKIKQRRRQIAMQIANQRLKKDVPTADVIVTNPTEFAVALKYDNGTMHAPRVIALDVFDGATALTSTILTAINWAVENQAKYKKVLDDVVAIASRANARWWPSGFRPGPGRRASPTSLLLSAETGRES